jgi:hypothetical protein
MKLSMVIERERFEAMRALRVLLPDTSRIMDEDFRPAYEWMAAKMLERLPPPKFEIWPLWAWAWHDGFDVAPPHERKDEHVVLEFVKRPEEILLSEFGSWHFALNNWFLPDESVPDQGEAESDAFWAELKEHGVGGRMQCYPEEVQSRIEKSWERTFDVRETDHTVQATFFSLSVDEIVSVRPWDRRGSHRKRARPILPAGLGNCSAACPLAP